MEGLFEARKYIPKNKSIIQLEADWKYKYKLEFEKVKKEWLPEIREFMRDETGLTLHQRRKEKKILKDTNLNFDYVTDHEGEFVKMIDEKFPNLDFEELIANRSLFSELKKSEKYFSSDNKPNQEFFGLKKFVNNFLKENDVENIILQLFKNKSSNFDIFGSYTFATSRVQIFYLPLILFSRIKEISLENVLVVTLVHEIGHAFHHAGKDKDGVKWNLMSQSDIHIIEGLAQYYTSRFVDVYSSQYPTLKEAYDTILSCQSGPYLVHQNWRGQFKKEHVKHALTVIRRNQKLKYEDFMIILNQAKEVLK